MGHNPLGCCFLNPSHSMGKNGTSPEHTDDFLEDIISGIREGTLPPDTDIPFSRYKGEKYTINRDGILKGLDGQPMKYIFSETKVGPRIQIRRSVKKLGEPEIKDEYYEINVLKEIEKIFAPYITGYTNMKSHPKEKYKLVPKDGDWANISVQNLKFISEKKYKEIGSKRSLIKSVLQFAPNLTDAELADKIGASRAHVSRVKGEMVDEGKLKSQEKLFEYRETHDINISQQNFPIYEALLTCEGKLSNMEIATLLRPEELKILETPEERRVYTDKIVRVRKLLADKGIIDQADSFSGKREQAVAMIKDKANSGLTNLQIAGQLGLKKEQIDNLARAIKKEQQNNIKDPSNEE